jgi:DNA-binding response OmpR family regulator
MTASSLPARLGAAMMPLMPFVPAPAREQAPILVVDDDPKILALVRTYLERERYRVVTAADGRSALAAIADHPRLVVLDLMIPEIDGLEVIRRARQFGDVPILVLSARSAVADRIQALTEGADDYLPKPFSPAELVVRVGTILRRTERGGAPDDVVLAMDGLTLDLGRHRVTVDGADVALSALELRLLAALMEAGGRVLTRDQLLDAIHGTGEGDVLDRSIDQYIRRLREKLGDDPNEPRYVATVRGAGYRAAMPVERQATPR